MRFCRKEQPSHVPGRRRKKGESLRFAAHESPACGAKTRHRGFFPCSPLINLQKLRASRSWKEKGERNRLAHVCPLKPFMAVIPQRQERGAWESRSADSKGGKDGGCIRTSVPLLLLSARLPSLNPVGMLLGLEISNPTCPSRSVGSSIAGFP